MKVVLTKPNRIDGKAGDIVEVSPPRAAFLIGLKLAVAAEIRERVETPEKRTATKETRAKAAPKKKK